MADRNPWWDRIIGPIITAGVGAGAVIWALNTQITRLEGEVTRLNDKIGHLADRITDRTSDRYTGATAASDRRALEAMIAASQKESAGHIRTLAVEVEGLKFRLDNQLFDPSNRIPEKLYKQGGPSRFPPGLPQRE